MVPLTVHFHNQKPFTADNCYTIVRENGWLNLKCIGQDFRFPIDSVACVERAWNDRRVVLHNNIRAHDTRIDDLVASVKRIEKMMRDSRESS